MFYNGYHFFGMHLVWWFFWIILMVWIFATPYSARYTQYRRDSPLDILKRQLASGQLTTEEYKEKKQLLEK
jgi:putative membrane protein